ncbi:MAG: alpha/beta hydrolase [Thermoguttaceae bacterium]|nr:alpha/beta hydrolase [Thermoguttaceae bacterium]
MKKTILSIIPFLLGIAILQSAFSAEISHEPQNIPYYTQDVSIQGDKSYAEERCRLDVYRPEAAPDKAPVLVWFHGGGLSGGNRHIPGAFLDQKFIIVPVNYRLYPKAKCQDIIFDAAAAVAWTFKNIEKYGGDPRKICVSGHSAGGYLSAMITLDPQYLAKYGISNMDLAASFPVSGQMTTHFQVVGETQDPTKKHGANNPLQINEMAPLYFTKVKCPPIHLLVGDPKLEWPARVEENALLAAMLRTVKEHNQVEFHSYEGTNHGTVAKPACAYIRDCLNEMK